MQETTFLILTALARGPQHGYGIIHDVRRISGERVALRAGTLYGALERLDADGLIALDREEVVDGRLRGTPADPRGQRPPRRGGQAPAGERGHRRSWARPARRRSARTAVR